MKHFNKIAVGVLTVFTLSNYSITFANSPTDNNTLTTHTTALTNSAQKYIADSAITAQIKAVFLKSSILSPFDIKVVTKNGVVFLSGVVDADTQYSEAISSAQSTPGVKDVNVNQLTVKGSSAPLQDTYITAKIKGAYTKASLQGTDVSVISTHVETKDGVVYLSGTLANPQQMTNAIEIAKSIEGVKSVKSALTVQ